MLGDVEDHDRVRVLEAGGVLRLAHGALAHVVPLGVGHARLGEDLLDRDGTLEAHVDRAPHDSHGTATNVLDEAVVPRDQLTGVDGDCS